MRRPGYCEQDVPEDHGDGTPVMVRHTALTRYGNAPQAGGTLVASARWNTSAGPGTREVGVCSASVQLEQGKTVQPVTLPAVSTGVVQASPRCASSASVPAEHSRLPV